jgi:hypothetical protein
MVESLEAKTLVSTKGEDSSSLKVGHNVRKHFKRSNMFDSLKRESDYP